MFLNVFLSLLDGQLLGLASVDKRLCQRTAWQQEASQSLKGGLGGNRNEAFHVNEVGWLVSDTSYQQLRSMLQVPEIEFRLMNLRDLPRVADQRIVFISNIDGSPQFLKEDTLGVLRKEARSTLLLSTRQGEWLA